MIAWIKDVATNIKDDLKKAHRSIVIWFNSIAGTAIISLPFAQENLPALQEYISPDFYKHAMMVLVIANIMLRFKTNSAMRDK